MIKLIKCGAAVAVFKHAKVHNECVSWMMLFWNTVLIWKLNLFPSMFRNIVQFQTVTRVSVMAVSEVTTVLTKGLKDCRLHRTWPLLWKHFGANPVNLLSPNQNKSMKKLTMSTSFLHQKGFRVKLSELLNDSKSYPWLVWNK